MDLDPGDMEHIIVNLGAEDGSEIGREHKHVLATMLLRKKERIKGSNLLLLLYQQNVHGVRPSYG